MVRFSAPQGSPESIVANTNFPPQRTGTGVPPPPTGLMIYNEAPQDDMEYNDSGDLMVYNS